MKIIDLQQNSTEWHAWRKLHVCATDAAIILGSSPYCTHYELWQRKLGFIEEQKSNSVMERGKELEPIARAWFNQEYKQFMKPHVVESDDFNFLGASLDGFSAYDCTVLEIKCNGPRNHGLAKERYIPDHYFSQIQHQLICTRSEKAFYLSYTGEDNIVIEVLPDPEFEKYYIPLAKEFWRKVVYMEPPERFMHKC